MMLRTRFWSVQAFYEQQVWCIFPLSLITALSSVFVARVCQIFLVNCDMANTTFIIVILLLLFTEYFLCEPYFRWPLIRVVSHPDGLLGWSLVRVVCNQGSLSSGWSLGMVFDQGGL